MPLEQIWWLFILVPFGISCLSASIIAPIVRGVYLAYRWVDDPRTNTHIKVVHTYPVPRGGGVVIFAGLLIGVAATVGFDKHLTGILMGAFILAAVGVLDDIFDIHPYVRLLAGLAAAACVVAAGIGIAYVNNPLGGIIHLDQPQLPIYLLGKVRTIWIVADLFALVWIVWCMNMLNWSKGVDGQLPGIVVIAATVICLVSLRFIGDINQWPVIKLAAMTAGAYFGLLLWNMYPQRIMPGYGGGSLAGYMLAVLSILSGAKLATLLLVLAVPMIDAIVVMGRRIRAGKSPIWGDRTHLHHILYDFGWGKRRIAAFYWFVTLAFGLVALQLNPRQKAFTIVLITFLVGGIGIWLRRFIISSRQQDRDSG